MTKTTPSADFSPEFARTIAVALTTYGPTVRLTLEIADGNDDAQRLEGLHLVARHVGLELIGFLRVADLLAGQFEPEDDPAPVIDLARVLGESLAVLGAVRDSESAARAPLAPADRIELAYHAAAKTWLLRYLPELPERVDPDGTHA